MAGAVVFLAPAELGEVELRVGQIDVGGDRAEVAPARAGRAKLHRRLALHDVARRDAESVEQVGRRTRLRDELGFGLAPAIWRSFLPLEGHRRRTEIAAAVHGDAFLVELRN